MFLCAIHTLFIQKQVRRRVVQSVEGKKGTGKSSKTEDGCSSIQRNTNLKNFLYLDIWKIFFCEIG